MRIMHKVTSGSEFTVLVLVKVPTHLLSQNWLVTHKLSMPMGKEAILAICAVTGFTVTLAKLQFSLDRRLSSSFIINQSDTHHQQLIVLYRSELQCWQVIPLPSFPATFSSHFVIFLYSYPVYSTLKTFTDQNPSLTFYQFVLKLFYFPLPFKITRLMIFF